MENVWIKIEKYILKNLFDEYSYIARQLSKKSLFHIRISWGCLGNCSYCGVKKAIGSFKSKPIDQCITEFRKGLNQGYKHFVINADDTGAYGKDIGSSLPELLDKITKISGKYEISIRNLHPKWIIKYIDDLEEIIKEYEIISVDVPLQSWNRRILKLMNRCSDIEKIKDAFLRLHTSCPDLSINTEFILGFPTETEEEFKQNLDFIKESDFSRIGLYQFSCKDGTEAENIEPKIPQEEILRRLKYAKKFMKNIGYSKLFLPKFHNVMMFYNKK
ncbi:2-methylthioadenine synthetase [Thermoplasmatales archaeon SCGC AB-539-C06]|nr:2-methylthioadenine synthetase [Thermoplasmatales archaeon SCGC AB-539-C06]